MILDMKKYFIAPMDFMTHSYPKSQEHVTKILLAIKMTRICGFFQFDCCAVDPVKGTKNDFDSTPWCTMSGSCYRSDAQIPRTCCTGVDETNYMTKASSECFLTVTSNYKTTVC